MTIASDTYPTYSAGRAQRVTFRPETTVGDSFSLSSGWASTEQELKVLSFSLTEEIERTEDNSKRGTLTLQSQFDGTRTGTFTLERYADVTTSQGPLPDEDGILNAFGMPVTQLITVSGTSGSLSPGDTITGGSSGSTCVYRSTLGSGELVCDTFSAAFTKDEAISSTGPYAATLDYITNRYEFDDSTGVSGTYTSVGFLSDTDSVGEVAKGAFITAVQYSWDGGDAVKMSIEGMTGQQARCSTSAVNNGGGYAAASTSIVVDDAQRFEVGSLVQFPDSDTNSGAGYQVTAINYTTDTLTIAPGLATGVSDNDAIGPLFPTVVAPTGSKIDSTAGSFVFDVSGAAITACTTSGFFRIETAYGDNRDCFGSDTYDAAWAMNRRVTGEVTVKVKAADMAAINQSRRSGQTQDVYALLGPSDEVNNNGLLYIYAPTVQIDPVSTLEIPEEDAVQVTFSLKCLGTTDNELQINYDHL